MGSADARRRRALSDTAFASVGLYAEYLFGLAASILTARALGPHDLGTYSLGVWIVATGVVIANAGITTAAIKFIAELRGSGALHLVAPLVRRLRRLQRLLLLAVLALAVAVHAVAGDRVMPGIDLPLFAMLLAALALRPPYMFNVALAKGAQDFRSTAVIALAGAGVNLLLVAAAFLAHAPLVGFVAAYLVASAVFHAVSRQRAKRLLEAMPDTGAELPDALRARLRHHLRVVAVTLILTSVGAGEFELLFLNVLASPADAGLFKVANALALGAAMLVPGVLALQSLPIMANAYGEGAQAAARRIGPITAWLLVLGAPLAAFVAVFADAVIHLFYGHQYEGAGAVLAGLVLARVLYTLGQGASAFLVSADRQGTLAWLTLVFSVLRLGGAWWAIAHHGLAGAVVAAIVLSALGTASTTALALREGGAALPGWRLLRIALAAALAAAPLWPLRTLEPPLLALALGGLGYAVLLPAALWLLRGLAPEDARFIAQLAARLRARLRGQAGA
jgi:O-antigen/teichoic acid export membrane protein